MKELILIRHADAVSSAAGTSDMSRSLSPRGEDEARAAGLALRADGFPPTLIISSSAVRTRMTAQSIAAALGVPETEVMLSDSLYNAPFTLVLRMVAALPEDADRVALVGHNPSVSDVVDSLTQNGSAGIGMMRTADIVRITFNASSWQEAVRRRGVAVRIRPTDESFV